jgi:hypothetical protein
MHHTRSQLHLYVLDCTRMLALMTTRKGMTPSEASELADAAWHWDGAYVFDFNGEVFRATRVGQPTRVLTADTPWELRELVRADYGLWLPPPSSDMAERSSI